MDFFDPEKQKQHAIRLGVGYALIALALVMATIILLYQAYGFGIDKNGQVIQKGLVFVSSRPTGAQVFIDGKLYKDATNTRMNLPAGQYVVELKRNGYHDWKRVLNLEGGSIERLDYPLLFAKTLTAVADKQYTAAPTLTTVSPDHRWLVLASPEQQVFDVFDLNASRPQAHTASLSPEILAAGSATKSWELVEWSKDNRHVVLKRWYDKAGQVGSEYILLDREQPAQSKNLSVAFGFTPTSLELRDGAYDQYYVFDKVAAQLFTASLKQPIPQSYQTGVLAFAALDDTVLYVSEEAPAGKVVVRLRDGDKDPVTLRQAPAGTNYLVDLAMYGGQLYVGASAQSENRVLIYQDPLGKLHKHPQQALAPLQVLKLDAPNYLAFSANQRFVLAQNAGQFGVFDAQTGRVSNYTTTPPLDAPQTHAMWLDGFHLGYVSGGSLLILDFDGANQHMLVAASPALAPVFDRTYTRLYTVDGNNALTSTNVLAPKDQQ